MARFFERQKLQRRLDKAKAQLSKADGRPQEADVAVIKQLEEDLQYVLHFPKGEKFVSLLKQADDPDAQTALDQERARLRALVRQQLADEALVADIDEGKSKGLLLPSTTANKEKVRRNAEEEEADLPHKKPPAEGLIGPKQKRQKKLPGEVEKPANNGLRAGGQIEADAARPLNSTTALNSSGHLVEAAHLLAKDTDLATPGQGGASGLAFDDDFFLGAEEEGNQGNKTKGEGLSPPTHQEMSVRQLISDSQQKLTPSKGQKNFRPPSKQLNKPHSKQLDTRYHAKERGVKDSRRAALNKRTGWPRAGGIVHNDTTKSMKSSEEKKPLRTRAEGGRKRRKKN